MILLWFYYNFTIILKKSLNFNYLKGIAYAVAGAAGMLGDMMGNMFLKMVAVGRIKYYNIVLGGVFMIGF